MYRITLTRVITWIIIVLFLYIFWYLIWNQKTDETFQYTCNMTQEYFDKLEHLLFRYKNHTYIK